MRKTLNNERGAVLVAGLMILVILSLLGITTMQTSTLEEKMANNMGQRQLAFQAAEAALRQAETRLSGLNMDPALPILVPKAVDVDQWWEIAATWTGGASELMSDGTDGLDVAGGVLVEQPRYIVENLQEISSDGSLEDDAEISIETMYRVTARGVGSLNTADVILQITHLR